MIPETYLANPIIYLPALRLADSTGLAAKDLLNGLGLSPQVQELLLSFDENQAGHKVPLEHYLSTEQQTQFLENIQQLFADPAAGLVIGAAAIFSDLGILGLTMLSAPTIRQAIHIGGLYSHIGGTLNSLHCEEQGDEMAFIVEPPDVDSALQRYIIEDQFAAFITYLQEMQGPAAGDQGKQPPHSAKLRFSYAKPDYFYRYQEFFNCPIEFNCARNEFWIEPQLLSQPAQYANFEAFEICSRQCQRALDTLKEKDRLIYALKQYITSQKNAFPKIEQIASDLGYTSRALRRKLENLNCSFSSLVSEVKSEQAQLLLQKADLSIRDVSELLGYTEVTNFRRAYRSWTGSSPSDYRRSLSL